MANLIKQSQLTQEEIKRQNCPIYCEEAEFIVNAFPTKKNPDPYNCYQTFKEKQ